VRWRRGSFGPAIEQRDVTDWRHSTHVPHWWRTDLVTKSKKPAKPAAKKTAKRAPTKKRNARKAAPRQQTPREQESESLLLRIIGSLADDKAENIVTIDMKKRSSLTDAIVIASGRSSRHVASIADHLARRLKDAGYGTRPVDGAAQGDWVLVDAGDVIVHVFRPEVREYYDLEGMWSVGEPERRAAQ
jgi:ribosome-associated protein